MARIACCSVFTIALGLYFRLNIWLVGGSIMKSTSPLWVALALLALTVIAYVATPPLRRTTVAAWPIVDSKADK